MSGSRPVRVALIDNFEVSVAGVRSLLTPYSARVALLDLGSAMTKPSSVDVILYEPVRQTPSSQAMLRDLVRAHGARVLVDEVHAPLVLPGQDRFVPYLSVDPDAVLVTSHSKTFGTPGLHTAQVVLMDPDETRRLRAVPVAANHGHSGLGMVAGSAAWRDSDLWLHALRSRLRVNAEDLHDLVAEHLPQARLRPLEATYLAWLDLRAYGVARVYTPKDFELNKIMTDIVELVSSESLEAA